MKHIRLTVADGIATLTLDNTDGSQNLVSPDWVADMDAAITRITEDDAVRGAMIVSAKRGFMAGADLKIIGTASDRGITTSEALAFCRAPSDMPARRDARER